MTRVVRMSAALLAIVPAAALAADTSAQNMKPKDFGQWFYQLNQDELKQAKLGTEKASSPQVKQYAQMLMTDHQSTAQKLDQLGSFKGSPKMTPDEKAWDKVMKDHHEALQKTPPDRFDASFLAGMVMGHDAAIAKIQAVMPSLQQSQDPQAAQLTQLASQALPRLQQHRQQAYQLLGQVGAGAGAQASRMGTSPGIGTTPPQGSGSARTGQETPPPRDSAGGTSY